MYVRTIQKSLVTILKPPATMVLKGTVIIRTEIVVFIRSRKWPAVMVREGVTFQRFLGNLLKQKPGKYSKVILSSVADPDLELGKGREKGRFSFAFPAGFSSFCDSFVIFFTQKNLQE